MLADLNERVPCWNTVIWISRIQYCCGKLAWLYTRRFTLWHLLRIFSVRTNDEKKATTFSLQGQSSQGNSDILTKMVHCSVSWYPFFVTNHTFCFQSISLFLQAFTTHGFRYTCGVSLINLRIIYHFNHANSSNGRSSIASKSWVSCFCLKTVCLFLNTWSMSSLPLPYCIMTSQSKILNEHLFPKQHHVSLLNETLQPLSHHVSSNTCFVAIP